MGRGWLTTIIVVNFYLAAMVHTTFGVTDMAITSTRGRRVVVP